MRQKVELIYLGEMDDELRFWVSTVGTGKDMVMPMLDWSCPKGEHSDIDKKPSWDFGDFYELAGKAMAKAAE